MNLLKYFRQFFRLFGSDYDFLKQEKMDVKHGLNIEFDERFGFILRNGIDNSNSYHSVKEFYLSSQNLSVK